MRLYPPTTRYFQPLYSKPLDAKSEIPRRQPLFSGGESDAYISSSDHGESDSDFDLYEPDPLVVPGKRAGSSSQSTNALGQPHPRKRQKRPIEVAAPIVHPAHRNLNHADSNQNPNIVSCHSLR